MEFDASLLVVMAIFWVVYAILRWSFFGPITRLLDERETTIAAAHTRFEAASSKLETGLAAQRERLAEARREIARRREATRREAEAEKAALVDQARKAARAKLDEVRDRLEADVAAERGVLAARAERIADDMVRRLLGRVA